MSERRQSGGAGTGRSAARPARGPTPVGPAAGGSTQKGRAAGGPTPTGAAADGLSADRLTVGYGGRPVLRELSVTAYPGRVLAVTGPSGAGKTTLLSALAGLLRPSSGSVRLAGEPLRDREHALARGVVLVPQDSGLAPTLTAAENLEVVLYGQGVGRPAAPAAVRRRAAEQLARLDLAAQADHLVEELSGGQQQRAAVARGLALAGRVLLADEVTSQLDAVNRERVLDLLRAEADRGAIVIFATHDPRAAAACDAELHLADGWGALVRAG